MQAQLTLTSIYSKPQRNFITTFFNSEQLLLVKRKIKSVTQVMAEDIADKSSHEINPLSASVALI